MTQLRTASILSLLICRCYSLSLHWDKDDCIPCLFCTKICILYQCPRFRQNDSNSCSNRTGYARQKLYINYAHEIFSSFSLFLVCLFLCYTQSSGQAGSLRLYAWAANLVFSQGDSCLLFIKEYDCPHLVRTTLGKLPSQ